MKEIQTETGAHVNVPKQEESSNKITIKGRQAAVDKAREMILELIKDRSQPGKYDEDENDGKVSTKLNIPKDRHRMIIGRGGQTINEIRDEANVEIIIPHADSKDDCIIIKGDNHDDISLAIKMIEEVSARAPSGGNRRGSNSSYGSGGRSTPDGSRGPKGNGGPKGGSGGSKGNGVRS